MSNSFILPIGSKIKRETSKIKNLVFSSIILLRIYDINRGYHLYY